VTNKKSLFHLPKKADPAYFQFIKKTEAITTSQINNITSKDFVIVSDNLYYELIKGKQNNIENNNILFIDHLQITGTSHKYYRILFNNWKVKNQNEFYYFKPNLNKSFLDIQTFKSKKDSDYINIFLGNAFGFNHSGINTYDWGYGVIKELLEKGFDKKLIRVFEHPAIHEYKNVQRYNLDYNKKQKRDKLLPFIYTNTKEKHNCKFAIVFNSNIMLQLILAQIPTVCLGDNNYYKYWSNATNLDNVLENIYLNKPNIKQMLRFMSSTTLDANNLNIDNKKITDIFLSKKYTFNEVIKMIG